MQSAEQRINRFLRKCFAHLPDNIVRTAVGAAVEYYQTPAGIKDKALLMAEGIRRPDALPFPVHMGFFSQFCKSLCLMWQKIHARHQFYVPFHIFQSVCVFLQKSFPDTDVFVTRSLFLKTIFF